MRVLEQPGDSTAAARVFGAGERQEETRALAAMILVVDDDDPVRVMLARLLRTHGYTVLQAAHASEARAILEMQPVDLVVSDIVMPGESGIDLRRAMLERYPELPFILISGYSAEGPAEFAARAPRTVFVQKPFAAEQFLSLVEAALAPGRD
jgi:DNA-binding NtrC family response regulator